MEDDIIVQLPNGIVERFPAGTDPAQIQLALDAKYAPKSNALYDTATKLPGVRAAITAGETGLALASSLAAQAGGGFFGGLQGAGNLLTGSSLDDALRGTVSTIDAAQDFMAYEPRTELGREGLQNVAEFFQPVADITDKMKTQIRDVTYDQTGNPYVAGLAASLPEAAGILAGYGLRGQATPEVRFFDDFGNPTTELRQALGNMGLDYDALDTSAQQAIPQLAPRRPISQLPAPERGLETAREQQVRAGGTEASLARLKADPVTGAVITDDLASRAAVQWDDDALIGAVKQASPSTRGQMLRMMNIKRRGDQDALFGMSNRPTDVTGEAVMRRVNYLDDLRSKTSQRLNNIADTQLAGKTVDREPVLRTFLESMDEYNVRVDLEDGRLVPDFGDSDLVFDLDAQKAVNQVIELLSNPAPVDALRMHRMKRMLDGLINYKSAQGLGRTPAEELILKRVRTSLNEQIRLVDKDYAAANDTLSQVLTVLEELDFVSGSKTNLRDPNAYVKIGQEARKTMTNYGVRADMIKALDDLDKVAAEMGGQFSDDVKALALFANGLDRRFGPSARGSFSGEITDALKQNQRASALSTIKGTGGENAPGLKERAAQFGIDQVRRFRNINDEQAYLTMEELLRGAR